MNRRKRNRQHHGQHQRQGWEFTFLGEVGDIDSSIDPSDALASPGSFTLSEANVGDRLWVVGLARQCGFKRLQGMGLVPGVELRVLSRLSSGSVVLAVRDDRLGLDAGMARKIFVSKSNQNRSNMEAPTRKSLKDFTVGAKGKVVGYNAAAGGYKKKLLAMGLTPGVEFTVNRHAPLGDPVEICVRGFNLSLRKAEAEALVVEEV
ncbi:FeoA family protein [Baaleninema simplex]|uniref:FeoA family protein n=1 Tax=Baaleninema simplex TaxID=2862350 RepID=UPI00034697B9|nr:FeoA family protein [Baaleninema simplex]